MRRPVTFKTKLWLYFALFAAIIFIVLWLLQTVFLQSFYDGMLMRSTRTAVETIADSGTSPDINSLIDSTARERSLLIYVTEENGNVLYSSDEYKHAGGGQTVITDGGKQEGKEGKGGKKGGKNGGFRSLPENYDAFIGQLSSSADGTAELTADNVYYYGTYADYYGAGGRCVVLAGTPLDAVGSAARIIRTLLAVVTVFSLLIGFALAWLIAKRFAKPVSQLTQKAQMLGEEGGEAAFEKGFCSELDDLSDTLDRTSDRLARSKTFQNELMANVSHDLRTPLTMIKGYAEEVGEYSWADEKQRKEDVDVIIREADRLTDLVNEIMEYSELQSQDGAADFRDVDLSALVSRVADNFESLHRRDGYTVERSIEEDLHVTGSAPKLERAVINLIDNALAHTGEDRTVKVRLFREDGIRFEVSDSGPGISEEALPLIWEKYYTSRQRKGAVSGLGLPIVKQIALLHGAEHGVETSQGAGSTFWLLFPEREITE